jgi:branched-chain amino acid transport system ATP-binding protein
MSELLRVENLKTGYGQLCVSSSINLAIQRGETVGIVGVNGAGKSTFLKTISGLLPPLGGNIYLEGSTVGELPAFKRTRMGIALVPEGRQIISSLTVNDNLDLVRASFRPADVLDTFESRLSEVFEMFPRLRERGPNPGGSLSGGEQQMLAFARALLTRPRIMMFDEPTQGLAPVIVEQLRRVLVNLKGRFGMILVEQNRAFLESIVDRVIEVRSGNFNC